ncbi:lysine 2,3-aminomutase, partial [Priestia megaterium]
VYPEVFEKFESNGVLSIIDDTKFNLTPEGLNRLDRRKTYDQNPEHSSLKDKREKRDQLKEKKFETQMKKYETAGAKEE